MLTRADVVTVSGVCGVCIFERRVSDRETEGEQGKEMQLNEYAACFKWRLKNYNNETQYVPDGVDSVSHRHKLYYMWETLLLSSLTKDLTWVVHKQIKKGRYERLNADLLIYYQKYLNQANRG